MPSSPAAILGRALLAAAALFPAAVAAQDRPAAAPVLTGVVVDSLTGAPLSGVEVGAVGGGGRAVTDTRGRFRLGGVAPGAILQARRPGYRAAAATAGSGELRIALAEVRTSLATVVVSAMRGAPTSLATVPASVTVLDAEAVRTQLTMGPQLYEVLSKTVPGMSMSREIGMTFGQPIRGRDALVLIDGVSIMAGARNGVLTELSRLDPSTVERIEVVRGASAQYGAGAAGGVINIITRKSQPGRLTALTTVRGTAQPTDGSGSFSRRVSEFVNGGRGRFDFAAGGSFSDLGDAYDADGDRIPILTAQGGSQSVRSTNLTGRVGFRPTADSYVRLAGDAFDIDVREGFAVSGGVPGVTKAGGVATPAAISSAADSTRGRGFAAPNSYLRSARLEAGHADVFGSRVDAQAFALARGDRNVYAGFIDGQLLIDADRQGLRVDVTTPLRVLGDATVSWGTDLTRYVHEEHVSHRGSLDSAFAGRELTFMPRIDQRSVAGFAQLRVPVRPWLHLSGGVRYEDVGIDIPDFRTHPKLTDVAVAGGSLAYDAATYNAGVVLTPFRAPTLRDVQLFGSFSQGFTTTEVGRVMVNTRATSVTQARPEPQIVDSWEAGVRGEWRAVQATLSGYRSTSELGATFFVDPATQVSTILRAPERVRGLEATVDAQPHADWRLGGTFALQEGEHDPDRDGAYAPLPSFRIAPAKVTSYAEHTALSRWTNRLQLTYGGERDEFADTSTVFGEGRVTSVSLLDLSSALRLGNSTLRLGVQNLLDRFYIPQPNQGFNSGFNYVAGRGRTISLEYSVLARF